MRTTNVRSLSRLAPASFVAGALVAAASPTLAQRGADVEPVISLWFGGAKPMLVHEKDAGMRRALGLFDERLAELPAELRAVAPDVPDEINLLVDIARVLARSEFGVEVIATDEMAYPTLTVWPADRAAAERLDRAWRSLLSGRFNFEGAPGPDGLHRAEDWGGNIGFAGVVDTLRGPAFIAGVEHGEVAPFAGRTEGFFAMDVDLAHISLDAGMLGGNQQMVDVFNFFGIGAADSWHLQASVQHDGDELVATGTLRDVRVLAERFGIRPGVIVQPATLRAVPADATVLAAFSYDFGALPDVWARAFQRFGIDVAGDNTPPWLRTANGTLEPLFRALGDDVIYYRSISTGGGGLISSIYSLGVRDADAVELWLDRWIGMANGAGAGFLKGYVTVEKYDYNGTDMWSVRTTGLPLPIDVTLALTGERLVVGLTGSNVRAAVDQESDPHTSIMENEQFFAVLGDEIARPGLIGISYTDLTHQARESHWLAQMITISAANVVRNRFGGGRDAGVVTPSYKDFVSGIRPAYGTLRWDGDDIVGMSRADGSVLVNVSVGTNETIKNQWAQLIGLLVPALQQARMAAAGAREQAVAVRGVAQARSVVIAIQIYMVDNNDRAPESLARLVEAGYIEADALRSPYGPALDGGEDFAIRGDMNLVLVDEPWSTVVVIDRAAYLAGEQTAVGMADGSAMLLSPWEVDEMLDRAINEGAREDFDL